MRTAIIGMGVTGLSCLRYVAAREQAAPLVLDTRDAPPNGEAARELCPDAEFRFGAAACRVIVSPGVSLDHELVRRGAAAGTAVDSDIDVFCEAAPAPVYAVTGTNGKSTVTALAGHLLAGLGRNPGVGGNIGEPALDLLDEARDCFVLELSSFQLERLREQAFAAATILNVTEDHLDRHGSMAAYAASKQRIYRRTGLAVANRADPLTLPGAAVRGQAAVRPLRERRAERHSTAPTMVTFGLDAPAAGDWGLIDVDGEATLARGQEPLLPVAELPIAGLHNALNTLAACALVSTPATSLTDLAAAVRSFRGLPHRCLTVAERAGVRFVDDSKATNVGATLAALEGLGDAARKHLVLIAGGDGKGAEFGALATPVGRYVKNLVLLGRDAPRLQLALADRAPITRAADMAQAVAAAAAAAQPGDVVLLSAACASLDMFRNYAHRGEVFAAAVEALA